MKVESASHAFILIGSGPYMECYVHLKTHFFSLLLAACVLLSPFSPVAPYLSYFPLFLGGCLVFVVCCLLGVFVGGVCWGVSVVCCLLRVFVGCCFRLLFVACCLLFVVVFLFGVWCLVFGMTVVCCLAFFIYDPSYNC